MNIFPEQDYYFQTADPIDKKREFIAWPQAEAGETAVCLEEGREKYPRQKKGKDQAQVVFIVQSPDYNGGQHHHQDKAVRCRP